MKLTYLEILQANFGGFEFHTALVYRKLMLY